MVDAFSTDGTPAMAEALGARVLQSEWLGYSRNKNLGNQAARHDWYPLHRRRRGPFQRGI
ncbi:MAG: glycosyltransferase [Microthrixaceae bacterium]